MKLQKHIWSDLIKDTDIKDVIKYFESPSEFQKELSEYINNNFSGKIIEVGSSIGITSALLDKKFEITLLDSDKKSIGVAKIFYSKINRKGKFVVGDMFKMNFNDNVFDLAYSAGVLEHYNFEERRRAIIEMSRIVKKGGHLLIAVPNHHSFPYRFSYLLRKKINKWKYPDEYKIRDFKREIADIKSLKQENRFSIAHNTIFAFLPTVVLKGLFYLLDKILHFESYLTVVILKKS